MQAFDNRLWRNTDGGDEEFSTAIDYYANELVEFAFCVVVTSSQLTDSMNRG